MLRATRRGVAPWGTMRRLIRDISSVLILSGLLLVLDAGVTLIWQEPVTAAIALVHARPGQPALRELPDRAAVTGRQRDALVGLRSRDQRIEYLARLERREVAHRRRRSGGS